MEKELDGAFVTHGAAEVDGNVITGRGMGCAIDFALKIIGCLISEEEAAAQAERIVYGRQNLQMNILFFLTPKSEVAYVEETDTLRQALEKMEHHGYAAVPLLSTEGKYLGTLTDGDVLWGLKELNFPSLYQMEEIPVMQVNRSRDNKPVHVDVDMEGLLEKVSAQNFVPVIDDEKVFIGIITRRDVIHYLAKQCRSREEAAV